MSVRSADKSMLHLYPPFRETLLRVLEETGRRTGEEWLLAEGLRSPERQTFLYAQGRTRPGKIITWLRTPRWHGTGLAADCLPKRRGYSAPMRYWQAFREVYHSHGLENPAWGKGDLGHVQLSDNRMRAKALLWVRAGCPEGSARLPAPGAQREITVIVGGEVVEDADAYLDGNRVWVALRPVADALDLVIAEVTGRGKERRCLLVDDEREWPVAAVLKDGRCFARASQLPTSVEWDGQGKRLLIREAA